MPTISVIEDPFFPELFDIPTDGVALCRTSWFDPANTYYRFGQEAPIEADDSIYPDDTVICIRPVTHGEIEQKEPVKIPNTKRNEAILDLAPYFLRFAALVFGFTLIGFAWGDIFREYPLIGRSMLYIFIGLMALKTATH